MWELLNHLLPRFELITEPGFQTQELGIWFWLFMVGITALCVGLVIFHRSRFMRRLKRVRGLIDGQDREALAQNRKATLEKALEQDPEETGALWREFDESLVYSADKTRLSNTLDAEHFFNSTTLAYGLTSSRLLSAAPSFLTAIGVLGTFIGLTLGLTDLQIDADEIDALKSGVSAMINGAAVAFMTSVWGVGLSLFLNMFEKLIERGALARIRALQQEIDFLYPRLPAEQSLVQIAAATDDSKEALQELHERIGSRLQETVAGISDSMQQAFTDALNNVMAPAIQTLVNNASQQSTAVLEKLVTDFMDGVKSAGSQQGALMQGAAADVRTALGSMAQQMETLFTQLNEQQKRAREHTETTAQEFAHLLEQQREDAIQRQEQMESKFNQLLAQLGSKVAEQFEQSAAAEQQRAQAQQASYQQMLEGLQSQLSAFGTSSQEQISALQAAAQEQQSRLGQAFDNTVAGMDSVLTRHLEAAAERDSELDARFRGQLEALTAKQQQLLAAVTEGTQLAQQQMARMADQHQQLMRELAAVTQAVENSSQHMNSSSTQLGLLSTNLKQATDVLDARLHAVTSSLEQAGEQNRMLAGQVGEQAQTLKLLQAELTEAVKQFQQAAASAEHGFESLQQHQQTFLQGVRQEFQGLGTTLRQQVEAIEKQADEWLRSYAHEVRTQVSERMEQWNETTLQFADQMRRTVSAISGLVDDLEQKR